MSGCERRCQGHALRLRKAAGVGRPLLARQARSWNAPRACGGWRPVGRIPRGTPAYPLNTHALPYSQTYALDTKTLAIIEVAVLGFAEAKRYASFKEKGEVRGVPSMQYDEI